MITFRTWLRQIFGYCEFLCDDFALRVAWVNHDTTSTSITGFDELYEQIFDDLDSDYFQPELSRFMPNAPEKCASVAGFLDSLRRVDRERASNSELQNPAALLASPQWREVQLAALAALKFAEKT